MLCLIISPVFSPNSTSTPSGGANSTRSAGITSVFLIVTRSPIPTPAFCLIKPSIRMMPCPQSCLSALQTFAAVLFLPVISTISPGDSCRLKRVLGSRRMMPRPKSLGCAFSTFICISSIEFIPKNNFVYDFAVYMVYNQYIICKIMLSDAYILSNT